MMHWTYSQWLGNVIVTLLALAVNLWVFGWLVSKVLRHLRHYRLDNRSLRITLVWWMVALSLCGLISILQRVAEFPFEAFGGLVLLMFIAESMGIAHFVVLFDEDSEAR